MIATLFANTPTPWPLAGTTVHVWRFACDQDPGALAAALSPAEVAIAQRFRAPVHRARYVAQHAIVRALLARYVGTAPAQLVFTAGVRGKPALAGIEHNLAHADDIALLAVARVAVGVDVERHATTLDPLALAPLVLAPSEAACVERRAFLRIWCRKEACLKATGVGLLDDLTSISVTENRVAIDGTIVHVQDLAIDAEHAAALATAVPCAPIGSDPLETVVLARP